MSFSYFKKWIPGLLSFLCALWIVGNRIESQAQLNEQVYKIQIGKSTLEIEELLGTPSQVKEKTWVYYLKKEAVLSLRFDKKKLSEASLTFSQKPHYKNHLFPTKHFIHLNPSTKFKTEKSFIIASAELGLIWELTPQGLIQHVSWQAPFEAQTPMHPLENILSQEKGFNITAQK